jgi:hypothetical protein
LERPGESEEIQLVAILRLLKKTLDEVAEILKIGKGRIVRIEGWLKTAPFESVQGLFVSYRLQKVIDEKLPDLESMLPQDFMRAARLTPDDILEHYREDYTPGRPQKQYQEGPHQKQEIDLARAQKLKDHWDSLALLAKELKNSTWVPDLYSIWREEPAHIDKEADGLQAMASISRDYVKRDSEADYTLYPYLMEHLQAESNWTHGMSSLRVAAISLSQELHSLVIRIKEEAQSKTKLRFSTEGPGLDSYFSESVYKSSLSPILADYEVHGTTLFYNGRPIAQVPESKVPDNVKAVHKELCQEVKDSPKFKNVEDAHSKLKKAFDPLRKILEQVALRGTFNGRCQVCPT